MHAQPVELEPSRAAKFCSASSSPTCQDCAQISVLDFIVSSLQLAFSVFIERVSRGASNERINSLYSCRKYKKPGSVLHQDLNFPDALAICSLISPRTRFEISLTKWRVYLPFPICMHLSCRIPGKFLEILHTWLRSHLVGLGA